ncbi:MAG TPA: phosphatase PAP2 family protein [Xanthobacteraceae bacterium]|nr:phosphatase PAP2 family protein [Xanthobacteraceae bacterium]
MNRTGLIVALLIAALVGFALALYPELDLKVSALFFDSGTKRFSLVTSPTLTFFREAAKWIVAVLLAPALVALVVKFVVPRRRLLISGRALVFLISTMLLAPGFMANVVKATWSRPRPVNTAPFNGSERFTPWWDPRGVCRKNCSLVSGEASGAFWTLAPAALSPPAWRPLAYSAAIVFGISVGLLRMSVGGHFFSDIGFTAISTFLVIWLVHGLIYRWRRSALSDAAVERAIERVALPARAAAAIFLRRGTPSAVVDP